MLKKLLHIFSHQNKQMPLVALCLGFFMVIIDVTIVNVALPTLAKELHSSITGLQWVVDGYTLTFACLLLSAGNFGDRFGAKPAFVSGLILFALTSFGCAVASTLTSLVVYRLLQGMAASLLVPTSPALINASYENVQERARAIGVWASVAGIAAALGPALGAVLTEWFGWRSIFFVNVPIGILGTLLTIKYVPNPVMNAKGGFDLPGQFVGIASIAALAFSLIEAGRLGWFSNWVVMSFILFIATFIIFLIIEYRSAAPMFPLELFRSPTFSTGITIGMILNMGGYGLLFMLPLYFQQIRGYSVLLTGLAIIPLTSLMAIASYIGGRMTSTMGPKMPILLGISLAMIGFFGLLIIDESTSYVLLAFLFAVLGFGMACVMPAATIAVIHAGPEGRAGLASGALHTSRQIGSLIGVAIFGTIISTANNFIAGMHYTLLIAGLGFAGVLVMSWLWIDKQKAIPVIDDIDYLKAANDEK